MCEIGKWQDSAMCGKMVQHMCNVAIKNDEIKSNKSAKILRKPLESLHRQISGSSALLDR
jgi:hypothetical protein